MKKLLTTAVMLMLLPLIAQAHVPIEDWDTGEILYADSLEANLNRLDGGLDDMLELVDFEDSLDVRLPDSYPLFWVDAFADSTATNDSLTITITNDSPIGDGQCIYIQNDAGVAETVTLIIDMMLQSATANLDSIRIPVWTETTDGTDYVTVSIFEDSLQSAYKSVADTTVSTLDSGTARTAVTHSITGINVGDILRFTFLIQTESDSMFIGVPKYYVTNP